MHNGPAKRRSEIGSVLLMRNCRLKLKLYRTLGIDVEADATTGEYNKAVIRNAAKGDVHVVNIDPKFSRHFYTNYFWRTM
jgi:kinetochore protein Spc24